jgi:Short C-terminal domain
MIDMPGLLRGVARTAAIAGTATAVSNRVSRRQANRWAQQGQAEAPQETYEQPAAAQPAPAPSGVDYDTKLAQLRQLGELHDAGVLDDAEFAMQKLKILNS